MSSNPRPPLRIGLTGNIAAGKSEVARLLAKKGCAVIDADSVAHGLWASHPKLLAEVVAHFGNGILDADGNLNRQALANLVFGPENKSALEKLNQLIRPVLQKDLDEKMEIALRAGQDTVLDAALIVEWGNQKQFDALWVVTAPDSQRLQRLMARNGYSRAEAQQRMDSQIPQSEKVAWATTHLENGSGLESLVLQVDRAWALLKTSP